MSRPIKMTEERIRQFKAICRLNPTLKDCSAYLEMSEDVIERYCKSQGQSFAEFRSQNMVHTRFSMIRKALQMADGGNTAMVIFCLKNLCGWSDKYDQTATSKEDAKKSLEDVINDINEREKNERNGS